MYSFADIFSTMGYHLHVLLQHFPFVLMHFAALILAWRCLRHRYMQCCQQIPCMRCAERTQQYQQYLLMVMVLISLLLSLALFYSLRITLYLANDYVYMAGVLIGWRRGWPVMLVAILCTAFRAFLLGNDLIWLAYVLLDVLIYYLIGSVLHRMLYVGLEDFSWYEILFICVNKIMVSIISAACWVLLMQDSWFAGFNILLFRLIAWPLVSLPVIIFLLLIFRGDYRQCRTRCYR
ncbi:hypothetical protein [Aquitalea aquatica]|uniref:Uncharacterized protein n=1 Tax=Aquitalea aquatica TaxID=3044273 RepID=A0A838YFV1_9NEIS|nr:hypothetical protein [Aquitalea magnusonii]MBA4709481.1 hypothetical protein [Aquitalea magnusonii]